MNDTPNMAEDFVLNGNCTTSTNQELIDQLCPKPVESVKLTPPASQDIPRVGNDWGFFFPFVVVVVYIMLVMAYHNRRHEKGKHR